MSNALSHTAAALAAILIMTITFVPVVTVPAAHAVSAPLIA